MAGTIQAPATLTLPATGAGWLEGRRFDIVFLLIPALLGIAAGFAVNDLSVDAKWSVLVFLWLLGQPHLVATFTRAGLDGQSRREHWFHLAVLPVLMIACMLVIVYGLGPWMIASLYFYWQSWHFLRQSYGIERFYARKAAPVSRDWSTWAVIYLLPLAGVVRRSHQEAASYLGLEVRWIPVPTIAMHASILVLLAALGAWVFFRATEARAGKLRPAHSLYVLTHIAVFGYAYFLLESADTGWLVISIWHSMQYMVIVWLYNKRRGSQAAAPQDRLFRWFSSPRHWAMYLLFCGLAGVVVFQSLPWLTEASQLFGVPSPWLVTLAIGMTFNFHHYALDAQIWRRPRPSKQTTHKPT